MSIYKIFVEKINLNVKQRIYSDSADKVAEFYRCVRKKIDD